LTFAKRRLDGCNVYPSGSIASNAFYNNISCDSDVSNEDRPIAWSQLFAQLHPQSFASTSYQSDVHTHVVVKSASTLPLDEHSYYLDVE
jgi:hypothetical protein